MNIAIFPLVAAAITASTALAVPMIAALLAYRNDLAKRREDRMAERDSVRTAVGAEVRRIIEVIERKCKWLEVQPHDPMNWLPINAPVWTALAPKIGLLHPIIAGELSRFFGLVAWSNDVLQLRKDPSAYPLLDDFVRAYRAAIDAAKNSVTPEGRRSLGLTMLSAKLDE